MAKKHELQQERATVIESMKALQTLLKKEERTMSLEERVKFDKMYEDKQSYDSQIRLENQIEEEERAIAQKVISSDKPNLLGSKEAEIEARTAVREYLRKGKNSLSPEHRDMLFNPRTGIMTAPEQRSTTGQLAGTAGVGLELVREEYISGFEKVLLQYGGVMEASRIIRTSTGGDLPIPVIDDTSNVGALLGEGSAEVVLDIPTSSVTMKAYKYTSKAIKFSVEMLQDDSINLEGEVPMFAGERIGRITNTHFTTGDNSSKPQGIVTAATDSTFTIAVNTFTRGRILDLIHSVDPAYRKSASAGLMMNDNSLKLISQLTIGSADDRPLWLPGSFKNGVLESDTIEGYPVNINQDMASAATLSAKVMLFGDFSKYAVRIVKDFNIRRTDDRHIEEFMVGFYGFARMDGRILNAAAIKYLAVAAV